MSLDGVMQAPGGPEEDPTGGFTLGGCAVNYFADEMMRQMAEADPYELLLGRGTYEIFAAHWPYDEGALMGCERQSTVLAQGFGRPAPAGCRRAG